MSYSSNAVKRLQHLYNVIFKRMKFNEWLYEHGLFGRMRNASRPISALEQLEPRVFLSATTMPTDDLVLHWTADALVAGKLEDTSGYGNAYGTLLGATITEDGRYDSGVLFDGANDRIYAPDLDYLNLIPAGSPLTQRTISFWFKADDINSTNKQILFDGGDSTQGMGIYICNGNLYVGARNSSIGWSGTGVTGAIDQYGSYLYTNAITTGWHHVVVVLDGSTDTQNPGELRAYLDGQLFNEANGSGGIDTNALYLTSSGDNIALGSCLGSIRFHDNTTTSTDGGDFAGKIDDVRIYNGVLNEDEISYLYNHPVSENDSFTVPQGQTTTLNILGNDNVGTIEEFEIVDTPVYGQIVVNPDYTISYSAPEDSIADRIRYRFRDERGWSEIATVSIMAKTVQSPQTEDEGYWVFQGMHQDGINGVDGLNGGMAACVSPDGKHVYVAAAGDHAIAMFEVNENGQLEFAKCYKDGLNDGNGHTINGLYNVQNIQISSDGKYIYASGYSDNGIAVFERNLETGLLTFKSFVNNTSTGGLGLAAVHNLCIADDDVTGKSYLLATSFTNYVVVFERNIADGSLTFKNEYKDGLTDGEGNTIDGLAHAYGIAVDPDVPLVYVTGNYEHKVACFEMDYSDGSLIFQSYIQYNVADSQGTTVGNIAAPANIAIGENGYLYVAGTSSSGIAVIQRTYNETTQKYELLYKGGVKKAVEVDTTLLYQVTDLVYSAERQQLIAASYASDSIEIFDIDGENLKLAQVVKDYQNGVVGLNGVRGLTLSPDENTAYFVSVANVGKIIFTPQETNTQYLEAEDAAVTNSTVTKTVNNSTAAGYVQLTTANTSNISWTLNNIDAGEYCLRFRYASLTAQELVVFVNDQAYNLAITDTDSTYTWGMAELKATLANGSNEISIQNLDTTGVCIDSLEISPAVPDLNKTVDFRDSTLSTYSVGTASATVVTDNGNTIELSGVRSWQKIAINYDITKETVLEFDFKSDIEGGVHAIGFDADSTATYPQLFQLYGSGTFSGIQDDYHDYDGVSWRHYKINVGEYYIGQMNWLVFMNEDAANSGANSVFSNVVVYEKPQTDSFEVPQGQTTVLNVLDDTSGIEEFEIVDAPIYGQAIVLPDHTLAYSAPIDSIADRFSYRYRDKRGWSDVEPVSVMVRTQQEPQAGDKGLWTWQGMLKDGIEGVDGLNGATKACVSTDGKHVYVASNVDHSVAAFKVTDDGTLDFITFYKDGVNDGNGNIVDGLYGACGIAVSPDGDYLYVAGKTDDAIAVFARNAETGKLTYQTSSFVKNLVGVVNGLNDIQNLTITTDSVGNSYLLATSVADDSVVVFGINTDGSLTFQTRYQDAVNLNGAYGIAVDEQAGVAYVTGSAGKSLAYYNIDYTTNPGTLMLICQGTLIGGVNGVGGMTIPKNIVVGENGYVYVAGYYEHSLVTFHRNSTTGVVSYVGKLKYGTTATDPDVVNTLYGVTDIVYSTERHQLLAASLISSDIAIFDINDDTLSLVQVLRNATDGIQGLVGASGLAISPDGNTVYTLGLTDDAIGVIKFQPATAERQYFEAESAQTINVGTIVKTGNSTYTGASYVKLTDVDDSEIVWDVDNITPGRYRLRFRYSSLIAQILQVSLNGSSEVLSSHYLSISDTDNENYFGISEIQVTIPEGLESISLKTIGTANACIDSLEILSVDVDSKGYIDFSNLTVSDYYGSQNSANVTANIKDGGQTFEIERNGWKKVSYAYEITENTVLEFDFKADGEGEVHAIGLDADNIYTFAQMFQLYGSGTLSGIQNDYKDYDGNNWQHYKIRIGEYYTGQMNWLVFINDDVSDSVSSQFGNIRIYEDNTLNYKDPYAATTVEDLAKALNYNAVEMYNFVRNNVKYEPYFGFKKGSMATLQTRAGNDWDQARLLEDLLVCIKDEVGDPVYDVRIAYGSVAVSFGDLRRYLEIPENTSDVNARIIAGEILGLSGLKAGTSPITGNTYNLKRAWLEIDTAGDESYSTKVDPAWKYLDLPDQAINFLKDDYVPLDDGISTNDPTLDPIDVYLNDAIGSTAEAQFNAGLLMSEYYENKVREYLQNHPEIGTIDDVRYEGDIIPEIISTLSQAWPSSNMRIVSSEIIYHDDDLNIPTGCKTYSQLSHRVQIIVRHYQNDGTISNDPTLVSSGLLNLPDVCLSNISVWSQPSSSSRKANIMIDGEVLQASSSLIPYNNGYVLEVQHFLPLGTSPQKKYWNTISANNTYATIALNAGQYSQAAVNQKMQAVNNAQITDYNGAQPNVHIFYGSVLDLAAASYYSKIYQERDKIASLTASIHTTNNIVDSGWVTCTTDAIDTYNDNPFAPIRYIPKNLLIDLPNNYYSSVSYVRSESGADLWSSIRHILNGVTGSAMEHRVWEDMVNVRSMSTIKSLMIADNNDGYEIVDEDRYSYVSDVNNGLQLIAGSVTHYDLLGDGFYDPGTTNIAGLQLIEDAIYKHFSDNSNSLKVLLPKTLTCVVADPGNDDWKGVGYLELEYNTSGQILSSGWLYKVA